MKIKIFNKIICIHRWKIKYNKYGLKVKECKDCYKTKIIISNK